MTELSPIEEKSLLNLSPPELAGRLMEFPAAKRLSLLLERDDAEAVVAALPAQDFHLFARELGSGSNTPLLALAQPEQFNHILDVESWQRDELLGGKVLIWCDELFGANQERLLAWLSHADFEFLVLLFKDWLPLADFVGERDATEATDTLPRHTLDGQYFFTMRYPDFEEVLMFIMRYLFETHNGFYRILMNHVQWSVDTELSELAFRFRRGRLQDLAIPDFEEACTIYQPLPQKRLSEKKLAFPQVADRSLAIPVFALVLTPKRDLLYEALSLIAGTESTKTLQLELASLANKVLVADGLEPDDPMRLREAVEKLAAYVNLGLEELCGMDAKAAASTLITTYLEDLFRLANTKIANARAQIKDLAVKGWPSRWPNGLGCLEPLWFDQASLLLAKTPMLLRQQGEGGFSRSEDLFRHSKDIAQIEEFVAMLKALEPLFAAVEGDRAGDWRLLGASLWHQGQIKGLEEVTLGRLVLTATAQQLWSGVWRAEPLPVASWPAIFPHLTPARLEEAIGHRLQEILPNDQARQRTFQYLQPLLFDYAEEMAGLARDQVPDPRLLSHFLFTDQ